MPPRYVNIPAGLVYDQRLSPAVRDTYIQLRGLAWGRSELFDIGMASLIELTGKSRATIYGHLAILRATGWLLFSSARFGGLTVRFSDAAHDPSKFLDSLNEEESINQDPLLHVNESLTAHGVQKSGRKSKNLDGNGDNGRCGEISEELADLLERVGVFRAKFPDVVASGWPEDALMQLARDVLEQLGEGRGGGIFLYRLANCQRPLTIEEQQQRDLDKWRRQASLLEAGDYEALVGRRR